MGIDLLHQMLHLLDTNKQIQIVIPQPPPSIRPLHHRPTMRHVLKQPHRVRPQLTPVVVVTHPEQLGKLFHYVLDRLHVAVLL